jgi:membrane protein implicated in regulation of membrane protease activity
MQNLPLLLIAAALTVARFIVPTVGHSWPMVFIAMAHIFVGVMLTLLWQRGWRWPFGWTCLLVPSLLEAAMFFAANG